MREGLSGEREVCINHHGSLHWGREGPDDSMIGLEGGEVESGGGCSMSTALTVMGSNPGNLNMVQVFTLLVIIDHLSDEKQ